MNKKYVFMTLGAIAICIAGVATNILSSAIQQKEFSDQFSTQNIVLLALLALVGSLLGACFSGLQDKKEHTESALGILINRVTSKEGSIEALDETGMGIKVKSATAQKDIKVTNRKENSNNPK